MLDLLIPGNTCYATTWYSKKEDIEDRIRMLNICKSYEDELSRTKNVLFAQSALLEVKQVLEYCKDVSLKWKKDEVDEKYRIARNRTLLFGGPVSNMYSDWLIKESPVSFNLKSPLYELEEEDGEIFCPDYDFNRKTYLSDYAVIIFKRYTRFAPNGVIGFMGCHGYGTLASAKILTSNISGAKKSARKVANLLKHEENFYVILEVDVDRGIIEKVDIAKVVRF